MSNEALCRHLHCLGDWGGKLPVVVASAGTRLSALLEGDPTSMDYIVDKKLYNAG